VSLYVTRSTTGQILLLLLLLMLLLLLNVYTVPI